MEAMVYRYFYDCEFIEDGRTVALISIGVVDEKGREFYAVSTEFDDSRAIPWVRRNVLDRLPSPADPPCRSRQRTCAPPGGAPRASASAAPCTLPWPSRCTPSTPTRSSCGPGTPPTTTWCWRS